MFAAEIVLILPRTPSALVTFPVQEKLNENVRSMSALPA